MSSLPLVSAQKSKITHHNNTHTPRWQQLTVWDGILKKGVKKRCADGNKTTRPSQTGENKVWILNESINNNNDPGIFSRVADVFGECYSNSEDRAYALLVRRTKCWSKSTVLNLATEADAKSFFAHDGVQVVRSLEAPMLPLPIKMKWLLCLTVLQGTFSKVLHGTGFLSARWHSFETPACAQLLRKNSPKSDDAIVMEHRELN